MKKTILVLALCFAAIVVISGCSGSASPAAPAAVPEGINAMAATATPALYIKTTVRKGRAFNAMRTPTVADYYLAEVSDNKTPVTTASVFVNGTAVPYTKNSGMYGRYYTSQITVNTNQSYTAVVLYKSMTYVASCTVPGGQSLSADALTLSWTYPGSLRSLKIAKGGVATYTANTAVLASSPFSIPGATAYPTTGEYSLAMLLQNSAGFSGNPAYIKSATANCEEYFTYTVVK